MFPSTYLCLRSSFSFGDSTSGRSFWGCLAYVWFVRHLVGRSEIWQQPSTFIRKAVQPVMVCTDETSDLSCILLLTTHCPHYVIGHYALVVRRSTETWNSEPARCESAVHFQTVVLAIATPGKSLFFTVYVVWLTWPRCEFYRSAAVCRYTWKLSFSSVLEVQVCCIAM